MNEQIQKLAELAGFNLHNDLIDGHNFHYEIEKFAQLIIQESIEVMMTHDYHAEWLGEKLKQHFGVEK